MAFTVSGDESESRPKEGKQVYQQINKQSAVIVGDCMGGDRCVVGVGDESPAAVLSEVGAGDGRPDVVLDRVEGLRLPRGVESWKEVHAYFKAFPPPAYDDRKFRGKRKKLSE